MRTVYCNDKELGDKLLVAKAQDALHADVVIVKVTPDMSTDELLDLYDMVCKNGKRCCVFPCGSEEFYYKVVRLFSVTSAGYASNFGEIEKLLAEEIESYTRFSVEDFVIGTAKLCTNNYSQLPYLAHVVEMNLKSHSVYPVVMTVLGMLESGDSNFTKFGENMQYFLDVFNKARNAEDIYLKTKSHCLSVLSAANKPFIKDWGRFEQFTLSVLLRPYRVEDKLEDRINTVVRTIKGAR